MGVIEDRRRIIAAQPHLVTASGSAVLVTIAEPKIERLKVTFSPTQTGSGTPSPSNVRPIYGWGTIAASIGTVPVDITLGGTYYGGTVDLVSGTMTVTQYGFTGTQSGLDIRLDHAETTIVVGMIVIDNSGLPGYGSGMISSRFSTAIASGNAGRMVVSGPNLFLVMPRSDFSGTPDADAVKQWLVDHPTTFVYTLATPQTISLSPQTILALRGQQTVTSPAGAVEISYWAH